MKHPLLRRLIKPKAKLSMPGLGKVSFSKAQLLAFVLVFGGVGGYFLVSSQAAGTADIFVSTSGNDSNTCTSSSSPCRTLNGAYQKITDTAAHTVQVACGDYGAETIDGNTNRSGATTYVTFQPATSGICWNHTAAISFSDTNGGARYVKLTNFSFNGGIGNFYTGNVDQAVLFYGGDHIVIDGQNGGRFDFYGAASNITIQNSDLGNCRGNTVAVCDPRTATAAATNILLKNSKIHDIYGDPNNSACGGSGCHADGISVFGVNGLTIDGVSFYNNDSDNLRLQNTSGQVGNRDSNVTIQNSWFAPVNGGGNLAPVQVDSEIDGFVFRFNSLSNLPNSSNGGFSNYLQCRGGSQDTNSTGSNCGTDTNHAQVYGNIMATAGCPGNATYSYNIMTPYSNNPPYNNICGTGDQIITTSIPYTTDASSGAPNFTITGSPWAGDNLVPTSITGSYPPTDYFGTTRPADAGFLDAGAVERSTSPSSAANIWVSITGNDSTCVRGDQTKPCLTFNKAFQIAQIGDVVEVACGNYGSQPLSDNPNLDMAANNTYVTFQPPSGQAAPGFSNGPVGSGCVQVSDFGNIAGTFAKGVSHVNIKSMYIDSFNLGKNISNHTWDGTTTDWRFDNSVTHAFSIEGISRFSWYGGQIGDVTSIAGGTDPGYIASDGTRTEAGSSLENHIWCSQSCTTINRDILFDSVQVHDVFRANGAHSACMGGYDSIIGLTIRNSKFWNCDTQGVFFSYTTQTTNGSLPTTVVQNVLFENNWIAAPTDSGGSVICACSQSLAIKSTDGQTASNYVVRNNMIDGNTGWSTDNTNPVAASNITFIGNIFNSISGVGGYKSPVSGVSWQNNQYVSLDGTSLPGTGNTSIASLPVIANPSPPNQKNFNYDLAPGSNAIDFVPESAYSTPVNFTTAFSLYNPTTALTTDIHGNSRPQGSAYDAGAYEYTTGGGICPAGDLNSDCHVTITDLSILLSNWGSTTNATCDLNSNGTVDIFDLSILLSHYGS